jgi:hypothetical protein
MITKGFQPGKSGNSEADGDAGNIGEGEGIAGAVEEVAPVAEHPEVEVGAVEEALVVLGEAAEKDVEAEVEVAGVGQGGEDFAAGGEVWEELAEKCIGLAEVFEDITDDNDVEGAGQGRQGEFEVMDDGGGRAIEAEGVFDAGDGEAFGGEQAGEEAVAAADIEKAAAVAGGVEESEKALVTRIGGIFEGVDAHMDWRRAEI